MAKKNYAWVVSNYGGLVRMNGLEMSPSTARGLALMLTIHSGQAEPEFEKLSAKKSKPAKKPTR